MLVWLGERLRGVVQNRRIYANILASEGDTLQLVPYEFVVWPVLILQTLQVGEDVLDFVELSCLYPKLLCWVLQASHLNGLDFIHCVLLLLSPLQLFVQEVKDHEVKTPKVVSSA